jgi:hypothetical protein
VRQLAAVQSVPLAEVDFLAGPEGARDGLVQEFDKFSRFVDWVKPLPAGPVLAGMGTRAETLALWSELTGIAANDVDWFEGFTRLKTSCLAVRMADLRGAGSPDPAGLAARLDVQ